MEKDPAPEDLESETSRRERPPLAMSFVPSSASLRSPGYRPVLAQATAHSTSTAAQPRDFLAWHTIGKATTFITYNIAWWRPRRSAT